MAKLLKFELMSTGRRLLPFTAAVVAYAGISLLIGLIRQLVSGKADYGDIFDFIGFYLLLLLLVVYAAAVVVILIDRYYRNLYGAEGYLMNALPVTPAALIASKLIAALLWAVLATAAADLSLRICLAGDSSVSQGLSYLFVLPYLGDLVTSNDLAGLLIRNLISLLQAAGWLLTVYASISLGQLMRRHRVLGAFLFYLLLSTVFRSVESALSMSVYSLSGSMYGNSYLTLEAVSALIRGVPCFLLAVWCHARKLELE